MSAQTEHPASEIIGIILGVVIGVVILGTVPKSVQMVTAGMLLGIGADAISSISAGETPSTVVNSLARLVSSAGQALRQASSVTGCLHPRVDGAACAGEDKGAVEAPGLFNGIAVQGLSVASSV
jgi:hypothetical protein